MSEETAQQAEVTDINKQRKPRAKHIDDAIAALKVKKPKVVAKVAKVKKSKKDTSGPCACGCGGIAKGGGFIPGHDSRLAGAIKRVIAGKPFEGERAYVAKIAKSQHPALITPHFLHLFDQLPK